VNRPAPIEGLLLLDKEPGMTSHDAVQKARRILGQRRIGHCGTLDPDATGLLILTLGKATRLTRFLIGAPKVYEGTVTLGVTTDTYDAAGTITSEQPVPALAEEQILAAMASLEGTQMQTPPPYCAKKIGGRKYYELAREGLEVPVEPKEVTVWKFQPLEGGIDLPTVRFRLECGSGTYARSLAHDLGARLGCGGHLSALRRTEIGPFLLEHALTLGQLADRRDAEEPLEPAWIPFDHITLPFGSVEVDESQARRVMQGQAVLTRQPVEGTEGDWLQILDSRRRFLAVGTIDERIGTTGTTLVQPKIVFP
jgi:tRNA pseudouridine55 synthase